MTNSLNLLENTEISNTVKVTFTYIWHIIGIENFIFGIVLLIMAFHKNISKVKFTAWLILAILALRWIVILSVTILNDEVILRQIIPDTIAIFLLIILLFPGTKIKDKIAYE